MNSEKFAAAIEKTLNFQLSTLNFFVPLRQNYSEMDTIKKQFAQKLMDIKAIKLQPNEPFTWASGWKSPIYTDNRKTLGYVTNWACPMPMSVRSPRIMEWVIR